MYGKANINKHQNALIIYNVVVRFKFKNMIIHCTINGKNEIKPKNGTKAIKVEFIKNGGYWAKWYEAYDNKHAKQLFKQEHPDCEYCRCNPY